MTVIHYLLAIISIILSVIIFKKYVWNRRWLYYHSLRFPGPLGLPLIGSVYKLLASNGIYDMMRKLSKEYSDIYKFWMGEKLVVVSARPQDIVTVLKEHLEKDLYMYEHMAAMIGDSLLTAELTRWKLHRKIAGSTLSKSKILLLTDIFGNEAEKLTEILKENCGKGFVYLQNSLHESVLDIAMETIMDSSLESKERVVEYSHRITRLSAIRTVSGRIFGSFLWKLTPFAKEFDEKVGILRDNIRQAIMKKENEDIRKMSLLNHLIQSTKNDENWGLEDKTDLCLTMVGAASHSLSSALSLSITALGIYKDIQEKVYQEQLSIFEGSNRNPVAEDLSQMVYLEQVINEVLRWFPSIPVFGRAVKTDVQLDDYYILPKDSIFIVDAVEVHRNPKFWSDPLKFDPDRFLPEEALKRPAGAFLPFSIGPRNCIGPIYAMAAIKVLLSEIVRSFKVDSPFTSMQDIDLDFEIVLQMKGGCPIALESRF